jgi:hypothetical protein
VTGSEASRAIRAEAVSVGAASSSPSVSVGAVVVVEAFLDRVLMVRFGI